MGRLTDWRARLEAYVSDCRGRPFEYGTHDCVLFAAGAVEALTGDDPAAEFRGRYRTRAGALRALRRAGYADVAEAVAARFEEIPVSRALPGDIAVIEADEGPALGVVQGEMIYVLREDGLGLLPRGAASRGYRV